MSEPISESAAKITEAVLDSKAGQELLIPIGSELGEGLSSVINLIFTPVHLLKLFKDGYFQDLKRRVVEKRKAISPHLLQDPPLEIAGDALEASKYKLGREELREMIATLLASSMDKSKSEIIQPYYVKIIEQLSREDVINLKEFSGDVKLLPITQIHANKSSENRYQIIHDHFFKTLSQMDSISISNLLRLGLVSVSYRDHVGFHHYKNHHRELEKYTDSEPFSFKPSNVFELEMSTEISNLKGAGYNIELKEGNISLTPLGKNFVSICL